MNHKSKMPLLGFGCMRLPKHFEEAEEQLMYALNQGITYWDTAYIYPGNEELLGKVLSKNDCRTGVQIATKLPHYLIKKREDMDKYFEIQLKRLRTDYVDYYLIHMLPDVAIWDSLVDLGLPQWIEEKKVSGSIGNIGFSYHGNTRNFLDLLDVYPWEFCQVQYNYLDEFAQAGRPGVEAAAAKGISVIVMEPLRGGLLAGGLPPAAKRLISLANRRRSEEGLPARSGAEWALRWLWDQYSISCVLSGMNSMDMLKENIAISLDSPPGHLTSKDGDFYIKLKVAIEERILVKCTACGYCMPCPFGVDIPGNFRCFNVSAQDGYRKAFKEYIMVTSFSEKSSSAGQCINCGACLPLCPQGIPIPKELRRVRRKFEHTVYKITRAYMKKKMTKKKEALS